MDDFLLGLVAVFVVLAVCAAGEMLVDAMNTWLIEEQQRKISACQRNAAEAAAVASESFDNPQHKT